ncbi:MAG: ATPase domain-containing protein [Myxococcales bacterium]|nr:ATPase domain-containing protein [Myxococcales bacterium]
MNGKVTIRRLTTGVPGLDEVLGGGLPEFSFNLISGPTGSGKTTLAHQLMFALATVDTPAIFFTVLGEPPLKMLRYQQQFDFFALEKVGTAIRFVDLSDEVATRQLDHVLARITAELKASSPAFVFVDSFRAMAREASTEGMGSFQQFVQQLAMHLTGSRATSFLMGEFAPGDAVATIADGVVALVQDVHRNSMVRKLQVVKMRGQASLPGLHVFRITTAGLDVIPPAMVPSSQVSTASVERPRLSLGVAGLDDMLGGGLPAGYSILVAGPSGSGKTVLASAFLSEGARRGEAGLLVAFEQAPSQSLDPVMEGLVRSGKVGLIDTRSLELSIDEIVFRLLKDIRRLKARRVVIDSLSGFELAVAPTFREDFRESLLRLVASLASVGVTVLMTSELEDRYTDLRFSPYGTAFLTDAIIVQRYIELESRLERVLSVVKVRGSAHSTDIRRFAIGSAGITLGPRLDDFEGLLAGRPTRRVVEAR